MNIANVLTASAKRDPRKAAIVLENESISYQELDRATTSLARWLLIRARGEFQWQK
jgi:acyl-CoA synthetase (AMP-forming)/AMP-acid ligase II